VAVGRLCTISLVSPQPPGSDRRTISPAHLVLTAGARELPFTVSGPVEGKAGRFYGCGPGDFEEMPVLFHTYLLTPKDPLPSEQEIRVSFRESPFAMPKPLVSFETTKELNSANCEPHPPAPSHAGYCQPPLDLCTRDAAAPAPRNPAPDAGGDGAGASITMDSATEVSPMTDAADAGAGAGRDAGADVVSSADAPAAMSGKGGCTVGGGGESGVVLLTWTMFLLAVARRKGRRTARGGIEVAAP
jgi:hypothetical protein